MPRKPLTDETFRAARDRLAARMVELRSAANLPQSEAARRAGMDRTNWGRIESGKLDVRLETLLRIQYALEVDTIEALFSEMTGDRLGRPAVRRDPSEG
jgi:transcriptional regulator with XRE-family HTH domain